MNITAFLEILPTLLLGYVSIFVVTLIIVICITALNKITTRNTK